MVDFWPGDSAPLSILRVSSAEVLFGVIYVNLFSDVAPSP